MKHWVMGFMFGEGLQNVVLIQKKHPEWQKGLWNAIGGKVEEGECPIEAMDREFREETGYGRSIEWLHTLTFVCPGGTVFVFKATGRIGECSSVTEEEIYIWPRSSLPSPRMKNLDWLVPLQLSEVQFPLTVQQNRLAGHKEREKTWLRG